MFNSIRGNVTGKSQSGVYIETGGVEWEVMMPSRDIEALPDSGEARVWTWLCHREDVMFLVGFAEEERRAVFLELLKVDGVGPKAAVKILGGISHGELANALENDDIARLEAVPGLGKKTAQKIMLSLKGKLTPLVKQDAAAPAPYRDMVNALVDMGYSQRAASEAISKAESEIDGALKGGERENALFRRAILNLTG